MNHFFTLVTEISKDCNDSGVALWRAIGNSTIGRAIVNVRAGILADERAAAEAQKQRELGRNSLDIRNESDENARGDAAVQEFFNGKAAKTPYQRGEIFYKLHKFAVQECRTLSPLSAFDQPMDETQMLDFMQTRSQEAPNEFIKAIADVAGVSIEEAKRFVEAVDRDEKEAFKQIRPSIEHVLHGWTDVENDSDTDLIDDYLNAFDELEIIDQHALMVKIAVSVKRRADSIIKQGVKRRTIAAFGSAALLNGTVEKLRVFISEYENRHLATLMDAMDAGRNILPIKDALK